MKRKALIFFTLILICTQTLYATKLIYVNSVNVANTQKALNFIKQNVTEFDFFFISNDNTPLVYSKPEDFLDNSHRINSIYPSSPDFWFELDSLNGLLHEHASNEFLEIHIVIDPISFIDDEYDRNFIERIILSNGFEKSRDIKFYIHFVPSKQGETPDYYKKDIETLESKKHYEIEYI